MKIVAIGGGNNSDINKNGLPEIYEQEIIDLEIISLTNKENPNVLYISHASGREMEENSYKKINNTYGQMFQCPTKVLNIDMLKDQGLTDKLINWADIIYVGDGDAKYMMDLWHQSGLDDKLIEASKEDKVLCGIANGASCFFKYSCSDYLQRTTGNTSAPYMPLKGLGLVDLIFNPHGGSCKRLWGIKNITEYIKMNGLSLTDNMAIEIIDGEYKLVEGISNKGFEKEAILSHWEGDRCLIELIKEEGLLDELTNSDKKVLKKEFKY